MAIVKFYALYHGSYTLCNFESISSYGMFDISYLNDDLSLNMNIIFQIIALIYTFIFAFLHNSSPYFLLTAFLIPLGEESSVGNLSQ